MNHLAVLPILLPLLGAAASLFVEHRRIGTTVQRSVAWVAMLATLAASLALVMRAADGEILIYLLGDWPARLGIVLMVDRLSALMVLVTALLAVACLLHACSGWDRRAPHFHALFQFQLVGLNGAFLTGDVFNLFVFFEVLLIASYGLMLSGGRGVRMAAGMHYVAFNVAASTLFLIGLGLLYGLLGTLNMAELAVRIAALPAHDQSLAKAAVGILLAVFCGKAAVLPLYLWLPETYTRAPAAVAALFVVMTKVGIYAVLRVGSLLLGEPAGELAGYGWDWLLPAAVATLAMAALGVLAASRLRMLAAYLVLVSAATLLIAFGLRQPDTIGAGLYYLAHSTFVAAALFMIADFVRRARGDAGDFTELLAPLPARGLVAGLFLIAAMSVAGIPPLSGFIGKLALLQAVPDADVGWVWTVILVSSLMVIVGLTRAGSRVFWRTPAKELAAGHVTDPASATVHGPSRHASRPLETAAIILLLGYGIAMSLYAAPMIAYAQDAGAQLMVPGDYVGKLKATPPQRRAP
ncbi:monovalent cation/H+ antiporter subunit D [Lysobacter ciconiae]|uniref:Monovalent cation/H+ antiporter subunit D n=1 Tax=Novilysobacter ciconiae TaxID=2781022 RepID=A0A7S6UGD7_9GAMM|nr:monovalent cation/H+ antiporter subunit D [Lysobacter ciconiae]QOW19810.1 monovalent cation/H+ antiporter subunit D [Lysobacter ciconiae]